MALFSNKIESVKFVDYKEKTIEVLYKQKTDSKTLSHYIVELNYDNQDFLDLIEEYSIEDIQDNTQKYYKNLTQAKNDNILNHAKRMFDEWVINAQKDLDKQDEEHRVWYVGVTRTKQNLYIMAAKKEDQGYDIESLG